MYINTKNKKIKMLLIPLLTLMVLFGMSLSSYAETNDVVNNLTAMDTPVGKWIEPASSKESDLTKRRDACYLGQKKEEIYTVGKYKQAIAKLNGEDYTPIEGEDYITDDNGVQLPAWKISQCTYGYDFPADQSANGRSRGIMAMNEKRIIDGGGVLLYLHRAPTTSMVFTNSRYRWFYTADEGERYQDVNEAGVTMQMNSLDFVAEDTSISKFPNLITTDIVNKNIGFIGNTSTLTYSTVPHVLGLEGTVDYAGQKNAASKLHKGKYMAVAMMDEKNNMPVPVLINLQGGETPFWAFYGENLPARQNEYTYSSYEATNPADSFFAKNYWMFDIGVLESDGVAAVQPFVRLNDILASDAAVKGEVSSKPSDSEGKVYIANSEKDAYMAVEHNFTLPYEMKAIGAADPKATVQTIGLGYRPQLEQAIVAMKSPLLVSNISLALDETITQRNSSVQFMTGLMLNYNSSYGTNSTNGTSHGAAYTGGIGDRHILTSFDNKDTLSGLFTGGNDTLNTKAIILTLFKQSKTDTTDYSYVDEKNNISKDNTPVVLAWNPTVKGTNSLSFKTAGISFTRDIGQRYDVPPETRKANGDIYYERIPAKVYSSAIVTEPVSFKIDKVYDVSGNDVAKGVTFNGYRNLFRDKSQYIGAPSYVYGYNSFYSLGRYNNESFKWYGVYLASTVQELGNKKQADSSIKNTYWDWDKNDDFGVWRQEGITPSGLGIIEEFPFDTHVYNNRSEVGLISAKNSYLYPWKTGDNYAANSIINKIFLEEYYNRINGCGKPSKDGCWKENYIYISQDKPIEFLKINTTWDSVLATFDDFVLTDPALIYKIFTMADRAANPKYSTWKDEVSGFIGENQQFVARHYNVDKDVYKNFEKEFCQRLSYKKINEVPKDGVEGTNYKYDSVIGLVSINPLCVKKDRPMVSTDNLKTPELNFRYRADGYYKNSYAALIAAWSLPAYPNAETALKASITYKEALAYVYFQFESIYQYSSDLVFGKTVGYRNDGGSMSKKFYNNCSTPSGHMANTYLLNEETRLNNRLQYKNKDLSYEKTADNDSVDVVNVNSLVNKKNSSDNFDEITSVKPLSLDKTLINTNDKGGAGTTVIVPKTERQDGLVDEFAVGVKYGPEIYMIDPTSGNYTSGPLSKDKDKCREGYIKEGNKCVSVRTMDKKPNCPDGYKYNADKSICIKTTVISAQCEDGYNLYNGTCLKYTGTTEICPAGQTYSEEYGRCTDNKEGSCPNGWTMNKTTGECIHEVNKGCAFGGEIKGDHCLVSQKDFTGVLPEDSKIVYDYTGNVQQITIPAGKYKLQAWGAEGGGLGMNSANTGGKGGYSEGVIILKNDTIAYLNVGGVGRTSGNGVPNGGYNGGGAGMGNNENLVGSGGGASDIRLLGNSFNERVIVAGGGGGGIIYNGTNFMGGFGGGASGGAGETDINLPIISDNLGNGGTNVIGGENHKNNNNGSFGVGSSGVPGGINGGGGGGWFGGAAGSAAGGGSGFVYADGVHIPAGYGLRAEYKLTEASTHGGDEQFVNDRGENIIGNSGNGKIVITKLDTANNAKYTCEHVPFIEGKENVTLEQVYIGKPFDFDYKGGCENWKVPVTGQYLMETWGAGGGVSAYGGAAGNGGFTSGLVNLTQGETLNVCVGGAGSRATNSEIIAPGGVNGGGNATGLGGAGGGMTSITKGLIGEGYNTKIDWNFTYNVQNWHALHSAAVSYSKDERSMKYDVTGSDPYIESPVIRYEKASTQDAIKLNIKTDKPLSIQIYFDGSSGGYSGANVVYYQIPETNGYFKNFVVPMNVSTWNGTITRIRLDTDIVGGSSANIFVRDISIVSRANDMDKTVLSAGGGGGGGVGTNYSVKIEEGSVKQQTRDDMPGTYDSFSQTPFVKKGQVVEMYLGKYSNRATATVPWFIGYSASPIPNSIINSYGWASRLQTEYQNLYSGKANLPEYPTWNYNTSNVSGLKEMYSFTTDKDGYYFIYTNANAGHSGQHDSVTGYKIYSVSVFTDDSGNGGHGGGLTGGDSVKGVDVGISGYGGTSTNKAIPLFGGSSAVGGAGGGGYYSGFGATFKGGGGGGSGYLSKDVTDAISVNGDKNVKTVQSTYTNHQYSVGNIGNGHARITLYKGTGLKGPLVGDINGTNTNAGYGKWINPAPAKTIINYCELHLDENIGGGNSTCINNTVTKQYSSEFGYTGGVQTVTLDPGTYTFETWGAQGGDYLNSGTYRQPGGKGGYSKGTVSLSETTTFYISVGGKGNYSTSCGLVGTGGFNGGGSTGTCNGANTYAIGAGGGGGGATDVRVGGNGVYNRIIVAGGGGGSFSGSYFVNGNGGVTNSSNNNYLGGYGGGETAGGGGTWCAKGGNGGGPSGTTRITGGCGNGSTAQAGSFGQGSSGTYSRYLTGTGGGGGWYGGQAGASGCGSATGGGGSSYVYTPTSYKPAGYNPGEAYYLRDTSLIAGNTTIPAPNGGTETGHAGNGYIKITGTSTVTYNTCNNCGTVENNFKQEFGYTGGIQTATLQPGTYKLETWGAQGGTVGNGIGGNGGYGNGTIHIDKATTLYVYVGKQGVGGQNSIYEFNGGGKAYDNQSSSGGGATDIRINSGNWDNNESLNSRIIVAGGGGGGSVYSSFSLGGVGGGINGGNRIGNAYSGYYSTGAGGTQTGPTIDSDGWLGRAAGFGYGGYGSSGCTAGSGGGGGWYGGSRGVVQAGGGGSGYVYTTTSYKPSGYNPGNQYYLSDADLIAGNATMPAPAGGTEAGHAGNGYVKITGINNNSCNNGVPSVHIDNKYGYTGSIQNVILQPGTYTFETWGAQGGTGSSGYTSGKGAYSKSTITVDSTTTYKLLVGGMGQNYNGGTGSGGGGTFVSTDLNLPISVAGGGGGAYHGYLNGTYYHGQATRMSSKIPYSAGTSEGQGGFAGYNGWRWPSTPGAGGGFYGDGMFNNYSGGGSGGYAFINGGGTGRGFASGVHGGFGGGGGTQYVGGGGGGYTGGDAGTGHDSSWHTGAGGGSYYTGTGTSIAGYSSMPTYDGTSTMTGNSGNGYIRITGDTFGSNVETVIENRDFTYTGGTSSVILNPGIYKFETWGASGGQNGGKGAYSIGTYEITTPTRVYINVGGMGRSNSSGSNGQGGFNGGGWAGNGISYGIAYGGGGATDIRIDNSALSDRVIVSGGGGGGQDFASRGNNGQQSSGIGGNASGNSGTAEAGRVWCCGGPGQGATQSSGGAGGNKYANATGYGSAGGFGYGGSGHNSNNGYQGGAGGGGGYFGGGGAADGCGGAAGGGGSSYIGGVKTSNGVGASSSSGNSTFISPTGTSETGHIGNGFARITALELHEMPKEDEAKQTIFDAMIKYNLSCPNDYTEIPATDRCRKLSKITCDVNYIWNQKEEVCKGYNKPTGCTSDGLLVNLSNVGSNVDTTTTKWVCAFESVLTCDRDFELVGVTCVSKNNPVTVPEVCLKGWVPSLTDGKKCEKRDEYQLSLVTIVDDIEKAIPLSGKDMVIEMGQVYSYRNYIGYHPSTYVAYSNRDNLLTKSVFFPQVVTDMWLFQKDISHTGCERRKEANCAITAEDTALQIPITLESERIFSGNKPSIDIATAYKDKAGDFLSRHPSFLASYPLQNPIIDGNAINNTKLATHLFAGYTGNGATKTAKLNSDFEDRFSLVEFTFKVEKDGIYVMHRNESGALPTKVDPVSNKVSLDWQNPNVQFVDFSKLYDKLDAAKRTQFFDAKKNAKGQWTLKTQNDKGVSNINSIAMVSSIDSMSAIDVSNVDYLNSVLGNGFDKIADDKAMSMMFDNNDTSDDNSALISGFKASIGDVYIDRFEILDETGAVIKVYDAMTDGRCTNVVENGYTEKFANMTYDQANNLTKDKISGCELGLNFATSMVPTLRLDKNINYQVKLYTKYADDAEVVVDPAVKEHGLKIQHRVNSGSANISKYLVSDGKEDIMHVISGKVDRTNITNGQTARFAYDMGWIPGKATTSTFSTPLKDMTIDNLKLSFTNAGSKDFANNANPLILPLKALANGNVHVTSGNYTAEISEISNGINKYKVWDKIGFSYSTGPIPDNKIVLSIECLNKNTNKWDELTSQMGSCLLLDDSIYNTKCNLYATVIRNKPDNLETTTNIKWNNSNSFTQDLESSPLKDAAGVMIKNIGDSQKILLEQFSSTLPQMYYQAYAQHLPLYNNFIDMNLVDNEDHICANPRKVNYSVNNVTVNPSSIDVQGKNANKPITFEGTYRVDRVFEVQNSRDINVDISIGLPGNPNAMKCATTSSACNVGGVSSPAYNKISISNSDSQQAVSKEMCYKVTCTANEAALKSGDQLAVVVKINGGNNGSHAFAESNFTDNESKTYVGVVSKITPPATFKCDEAICTKENNWDILFDFVYHYDSKVEKYNTNQSNYMGWTDYDVGSPGNNLRYARPIDGLNASTAGQGNELRNPSDYLAFKNENQNTVNLCTDYRNNNQECWRYEMNSQHTVEYYLASHAITSVYTTVKTLPSGSPLSYGKMCGVDTPRSDFGYVGSGAAGILGGNSGSTNVFYDKFVGQDRNVNSCHGYNQATNNANGTACTKYIDWWGKEICQSEQPQFSETANSGNHPNDYIDYSYFGTRKGNNTHDARNNNGDAGFGYYLTDARGTKSQTTKTSKIVLLNKFDQGAENIGLKWVKDRKMDVCTLRAPKSIAYSCKAYYTYGTAWNSLKYNETITDGYGKCYSAYHSDTTRSCEWTNDNMAPPDEQWWNNNGATCYRQHRDYTCDSYYSFSNTNGVSHNNGDNNTRGTCNWSETVSPDRTTHNSGTDHASCSNYCSSTCNRWGPAPCIKEDKYHKCLAYGPKPCTGYTSGTCYCNGSSGCARAHGSCSYGGGSGCTASDSGSATWYSTYSHWTASDGQTSSASDSSCSWYPSFGSRTFYHSETYDGPGKGNNMHFECSSGDTTIDLYCYEKYNDSASLVTSDDRCIRWKSIDYKEIKYITTNTPSNTFISRTYQTLQNNLWQFRCANTAIKYPDTLVVKRYNEKFTSQMYIATQRTGGKWVLSTELKHDDMPRAGEWMDIKVNAVYTTTRGTKPSPMPYLTGFYNNYHNITNNSTATNSPVSYNHFNYNSTFAEVINNQNYGYCNARVAEPYGCQFRDERRVPPNNNYTQNNIGNTNTVYVNKYQFAEAGPAKGKDGINDHTQAQGNASQNWITETSGIGGKCFYGPDDNLKWGGIDNIKTTGIPGGGNQSMDGFNFGMAEQYSAQIQISKKDAVDGKEKLQTVRNMVGTGACNSRTDGLCTKYSVDWILEPTTTATGTKTNKIYIDVNSSYEDTIVKFANSYFWGVGKYEQIILNGQHGGSVWGNDVSGAFTAGGKYFNLVNGNDIRPLCACKEVTISNPGEVGWGTTEWEVE